MNTAIYPGSFDPFTNGHLDILRDASAIFDRVVVAVGAHPTKSGMLDPSERITLVEACIDEADLSGRATAREFDGLVIEAARDWGASAIVRGVRDGTDLDYEMQMIGMNREMAPEVATVLLPPRTASRHVTGTLVRQIAAMGGDVSPFVPAATLAMLGRRAK